VNATGVDLRVLDALGGRIRAGSLEVKLPDGQVRTYRGEAPGPWASVHLHRTRLLRRLLTLGAIGLADGYVAGDFDTPDLAAVIELGALHLEREHAPRVPAALESAARGAWRALGRAAAPRGPLENIVQHYDLGNDFFATWLDPTMTYSSAVFTSETQTLEEAQREKYRRLAAETGLEPGDRVLEIGSGWGAFAVYAAGTLGCHVTTTTVSRRQAEHVRELVRAHGLQDRVEVRVEDFAATRGVFDRVISVEMIESIPKQRWDPYVAALHDRTRPGGTIGLQVIVVADRHWRSSDRNPDFIRRYVFPGGQVPAPSVLRSLVTRHGLAWTKDEGFGASYARTLHHWGERFDEQESRLAAMGYDEPFRRMWRYYLAYCEGGFRAGRVDVRQIVLAR
jgi:cyclopropane-fatty-acyl-phospholipid synthase